MELKKNNALAARRFFSSEAGQELVSVWREKSPSIPSGEPHAIVFAAGKVEGFKLSIDVLLEIIQPANKNEQELENPGLAT